MNEVKNYLTSDVEVRRGDVLSAWAGIRPLVKVLSDQILYKFYRILIQNLLSKDPNNEGETQELVRNHVIHVSPSNMVTIAGGKWTTYRVMAQETLDAAIKACDLKPKCDSKTDGLLLEGAHTWTPTQFIRLVQVT